MYQVSTISNYAALVAFISTIIWLGMLAVLHFVKPDLKPSTSLVSEYAIQPKGWIMQVAFFCMAIGCFALAIAAWPYLSLISLVLLMIVGVGFIGAGIFTTDPAFIGEGGKTRSGNLHALFAFLVIFIFPVMATIVDVRLSNSVMWSTIHAFLPAMSLLVWLGFGVFIGTSGYRVSNIHAPVGYAERFLIVTFSLWLLVVSFPLFS